MLFESVASLPPNEEWRERSHISRVGVVATGVVLSHYPFGFSADLGDAVIGPVEISCVKEPDQPVGERDYPPVGQEIIAAVLGAVDLQRQVDLSIRHSDMKAAN